MNLHKVTMSNGFPVNSNGNKLNRANVSVFLDKFHSAINRLAGDSDNRISELVQCNLR